MSGFQLCGQRYRNYDNFTFNSADKKMSTHTSKSTISDSVASEQINLPHQSIPSNNNNLSKPTVDKSSMQSIGSSVQTEGFITSIDLLMCL